MSPVAATTTVVGGQQQQQQKPLRIRSLSVDKNEFMDDGSHPGSSRHSSNVKDSRHYRDGGGGGGDDDLSLSSHSNSSVSSVNSQDQQANHNNNNNSKKPLDPPILVYHESARSIVFRDHLRRAVQIEESNKKNEKLEIGTTTTTTTTTRTNPSTTNTTNTTTTTNNNTNSNTTNTNTTTNDLQQIVKLLDPKKREKLLLPGKSGIDVNQIGGYTPNIVPLPKLELGPNDEYYPLLLSSCSHNHDNENNNNNTNNIMNTDSNSTANNTTTATAKLDEEGLLYYTTAELEVVDMLRKQRCCVKTLKNSDWSAFIARFQYTKKSSHYIPSPSQSQSQQQHHVHHHHHNHSHTHSHSHHHTNNNNTYNKIMSQLCLHDDIPPSSGSVSSSSSSTLQVPAPLLTHLSPMSIPIPILSTQTIKTTEQKEEQVQEQQHQLLVVEQQQKVQDQLRLIQNQIRPFNSFVTSTTMLPPYGKRMRSYGSTSQYTTGVVFALPNEYDYFLLNNTDTNTSSDDGTPTNQHNSNEIKNDTTPDATATPAKPSLETFHAWEHYHAQLTNTWSWPAGYSAKTEFNIDSNNGQLINGRYEALRSLGTLRQYNIDYCTKEEYMVGHRLVSGLSQIPYNEIYLRVGGVSRLVQNMDVATTTTTENDSQTNDVGTNDDNEQSKETLIIKKNEKYRRSFEYGVGLPVALFVRTAKFGDLITLLRTRARLIHILGEKYMKEIPLLYIHPEKGVRVLTQQLQGELWKIASNQLNPFQNQAIAYQTSFLSNHDQNNDSNNDPTTTTSIAFQQKVDELIQFDSTIQNILTPEELVRIAGGFGATDESVANILQQVYDQDQKMNQAKQQQQQTQTQGTFPTVDINDDAKDGHNDVDKPPIDYIESSHRLQDVVNEGLTAAVRAGDYHTSRQLLILYSLVASSKYNDDIDDDDDNDDNEDYDEAVVDLDDNNNSINKNKPSSDGLNAIQGPSSQNGKVKVKSNATTPKKESGRSILESSNSDFKQMEADVQNVVMTRRQQQTDICTSNNVYNTKKLSKKNYNLPPPPPPPPLDTDRLRSATNSDGLLAVLGAAEVLKAMRTGSAQRRTLEAVSAVEEWVNYGEQSMAFRISSWYDQRAAQGDLQIATGSDTNFLAFVSTKAIMNRKLFASKLKMAAESTDYGNVRFLQAVLEMVQQMNSPCLRLELLQYILGLDNRYSVAHVKRSVELAATCLQMAHHHQHSYSSPNNHSSNQPHPPLLLFGQR